MNIEGIAAIVTGGASGLGAATAKALAAKGAKITILDMNIALAKTIADEIDGLAIECNVADELNSLHAIKESQEKHGYARILVNCAGIATPGRVVSKNGAMPLADFEKVIKINLLGSFNILRLVAAELVLAEPMDNGERGVLISTASIAAYEGQIGQASYAASKGGIVGMILPIARELASFGIRVNAIAPGLFLTPLLEGLSEDAKYNLSAAIPFPKRLGLPEEYASLVIHMIENSYINGEIIRLDGALRMQPR